MLARSKSNGSSMRERSRSMFQAWKNSCESVPSSPAALAAIEPEDVRIVELRCSIPSPDAYGR